MRCQDDLCFVLKSVCYRTNVAKDLSKTKFLTPGGLLSKATFKMSCACQYDKSMVSTTT